MLEAVDFGVKVAVAFSVCVAMGETAVTAGPQRVVRKIKISMHRRGVFCLLRQFISPYPFDA